MERNDPEAPLEIEASQMGAFMSTLAFARLHKIWAARCDAFKGKLLRGAGDTYEDVQVNRAKLAVYEDIFRDFNKLKGNE